MKENTLRFKLAICADRTFNLLTGGSFKDCLSTRAYVQAEKALLTGDKLYWLNIRSAIDWMFWDGHCEDSLRWELRIKQDWINAHRDLLK